MLAITLDAFDEESMNTLNIKEQALSAIETIKFKMPIKLVLDMDL